MKRKINTKFSIPHFSHFPVILSVARSCLCVFSRSVFRFAAQKSMIEFCLAVKDNDCDC